MFNFSSRLLFLFRLSGSGKWGMGAVVSLSHLSLLLLPPHILSLLQREVPPNFSSMSPSHVLQFFMNCPGISSSMATASFRCLLRCGVFHGLQVISAGPWTSVGCRGIACLIIVFSTGCRRISALVPGASPLPPFSLILRSASLLLCSSFSPS